MSYRDKITFFASANDFRLWLTEHYHIADELIVGFWKVGCGKASMTWSESVDQALCFGWIDGVRRSIDAESYCIRFTPRRPKSIWSAVNIRKVEQLTDAGLMLPAGLKAFSLRKPENSAIYSFENEAQELSPDLQSRFASHTDAFQFFNRQAPSYRKTIICWVMSAKQETTRTNRLTKLIAACCEGVRLR